MLFLQFRQNFINGFLRVAEAHHAVFVEEQRVLYACVAGIHRAFEDDDFFCLPHFQYGHAGNRAVRVGLGSGVDGIVRADNQHYIGFREVVVDFVHFQHDVVGDFGFGEQYVHMTGQAAGDGVDAEAYFGAVFTQKLGDFGNGVLRLRHCHAVARGDNDAAGVAQHFGDFGGFDFAVFADFLAAGGCGGTVGTETACNHGDEGAVHGFTHDVGQNRAARTDQRAGNDEQVVGEHEACGCGRPAGVGVQHGHDHGHIRATDGGDQVPAECEGDQGHQDEDEAAAVNGYEHQHQDKG